HLVRAAAAGQGCRAGPAANVEVVVARAAGQRGLTDAAQAVTVAAGERQVPVREREVGIGRDDETATAAAGVEQQPGADAADGAAERGVFVADVERRAAGARVDTRRTGDSQDGEVAGARAPRNARAARVGAGDAEGVMARAEPDVERFQRVVADAAGHAQAG